jgi:hypothetical protein
METLMKGFWIGLLLTIMAANQGCGQASSSSAPPSSVVVTGKQVVITLYNSGTQDSSMGSTLQLSQVVKATIPAAIIRTQGSTLANGIAVGVDFGSGIGQCYYNGNTGAQNVFTLAYCTNGLLANDVVNLAKDSVLVVWSYNHINSSDSIVELVIQGESL